MIGLHKIKKTLFFAFGGAFLLLLTGVILSFIFEDKIKGFALEKIGENVTTEINVDEVKFSLFKKFPSASLQFKNVLIKETFKEKDTLLFAKDVFLEFNVIDIIRKKYDVNTISIDQGITKLKWKKNNKDNFHFWKETEGNSSVFSFSIEQIVLTNSFLEIDHQPSDFYLSSAVDNIKAKGEFDNQNLHISSSINLILNTLRKGNVEYSDHYHLAGIVQTNINQNGRITLNNSAINIDDIPLDIEGVIDNEKTTKLDLKISSSELDIAQLLKHLPKNVKEKIQGYKTSGEGSVICIIKGESDEKNNPDVLINYEIKNGVFEHLLSGTEIDKIQAHGKFTVLNGEPEKLTLSQLKSSFEGNDFELNGWVENFSNPKFDFFTKGHVSLEDVKNFADIEKLDEFTGILDLNTRFEGQLSSFNAITVDDLKKVNIRGAAIIHNTTIIMKDSPREFENIEARLIFNNLKTEINFINGNVEDSDFHLEGSLINILPYLFFENEKLQIIADFSSENLNFNNLITEHNSSSENEGVYHFIFPDDLDFDIKAKVKHFEFRRFKADDLDGTAHLKNKIFTIDPVSFATSEGNCYGNLSAKSNSKNDIQLVCELKVNNIDINQLFYEFENFGQDLIVQDNIKGLASADIHFSSFLNSALEFDVDKILSTVNITINDGELIELSAMSEISKYISTNRMLSKLINEQKLDNKLRHINFSKLSNTIIIADNQVRIPSMDIYSSAMDITVAGTHSFDNKLDYSLGFKIRDILSSNEKSEFGDIEDDGLSNSFFLSMKGSPSNLSFGYDNLAHREKRKEDFKNEKNTFQELIKNEIHKKNTSPNSNNATTKTIVENQPPKKKKKKWFEKTDIEEIEPDEEVDDDF